MVGPTALDCEEGANDADDSCSLDVDEGEIGDICTEPASDEVDTVFLGV